MARSMGDSSDTARARRVSVAVEADGEPRVKARKLRELAAWYRALAMRAANPAIWEARLLTADDLDAEASRIDPPGQELGPSLQTPKKGRTSWPRNKSTS
jgi:hypothetical protein